MQPMQSFETEPREDAYLLNLPLSTGDRRLQTHLQWLFILSFANVMALAVGVAALVVAGRSFSTAASLAAAPASFVPFSRLAFGSCTSHDEREQPVWTQGVIPYHPDAWLWLGDMAYVDNTAVNCELAPQLAHCRCPATWLSAPPYECMAGNVDHARDRMMVQLAIPEYRQFLRHMCPGTEARGLFPPPGTDPAQCPRPIMGVYDDHDFGWNNGNGRLPQKHIFKNLFLDAIGEARDSPRRNYNNGLQALYTLNKGVVGREVDVILLDERYFRDTVPCDVRRDWCTAVLAAAPAGWPADLAWCSDFLVDDGVMGRGSCCAKDEAVAAWCAQFEGKGHALWSTACDATSSLFGMTNLVLLPDNVTLLTVTADLWDTQAGTLWRQLMQGSPFCDVLGMQQRRWLQEVLATSTAPLKLVASGSVLMGSMGFVDPHLGRCSADDWECWKPAQRNLVHTLSNVSTGCVVVLTGDYHYGDIKAAMPGSQHAYGIDLVSKGMRKPVYQVMASGLTNSTAVSVGQPCEGSYREDLVGLRPLGRCSYVPQPNFGGLDVDWERQVVTLSIRDAVGGGVAKDRSGALRSTFSFSLKDCSSSAA